MFLSTVGEKVPVAVRGCTAWRTSRHLRESGQNLTLSLAM